MSSTSAEVTGADVRRAATRTFSGPLVRSRPMLDSRFTRGNWRHSLDDFLYFSFLDAAQHAQVLDVSRVLPLLCGGHCRRYDARRLA